MKTKLINGVLWVAFILAMLASIQHLAYTFGTAEQAGAHWLGWIPAIAVDAGLASLAYTIQQRKRAKRPVRVLWGGVIGFAIISALANLYHALAVESGGKATLSALQSLDFLQIAKSVVLSATLPALVVYLGEIVSGDDAAAAKASDAEAERERARAEREARRAELEALAAADRAKADLLEAERLAKEAENHPLASEPAAIQICQCGFQAKNQNAMNAHKRTCPLNQNGKANNVPIVSTEAEKS